MSDTPLTDLLTDLVALTQRMGAEAARDAITAWRDGFDQDTTTFEVALIDGISEALRLAQEADEDITRSITIRQRPGELVHFSWREDAKDSPAFRAAVHNAVRLTVGSSPPRVSLPFDPSEPRQWSVAEHSGDCFREDDDYDGWILQIEIRDEAEAARIAAHMQGLWPMEASDG